MLVVQVLGIVSSGNKKYHLVYHSDIKALEQIGRIVWPYLATALFSMYNH